MKGKKHSLPAHEIHHGRSHKHRKKGSRLRKFLIFSGIILALVLLGLNFLSAKFLGVSIATLANDALIVSGLNGPTIEEIQAMPTAELNQNVQEFIDVFNEANPPEPIALDNGIQGLRVLDNNEVILEATINVQNGKIISIDYSGLPQGVTEEDIIEMPENMFRIVFGGEIPESFPGALKTYSESRGGAK